MDSEIIAKLDTIADLMRQRLELEQRKETNRQGDRAAALERMREFKMDFPKIEVPKVGGDEFSQKLERVAERDRQERNEFQQALLTEMRRQSAALEKLAESRQ